MAITLIDDAVIAGARCVKACEIIGLSERTLRRWRSNLSLIDTGLFDNAKKSGWDGDAASNGIFLPGDKDLAKTLDLPGHWSNHRNYPVLFMRALKVTHFRQLDDPLTVFGLEGTIFGSVFTLSA